MKISEFIKTLESIKDEHGDLDVYYWPYDGQGMMYSFDQPPEPVEPPLLDGKKVLTLEEPD